MESEVTITRGPTTPEWAADSIRFTPRRADGSLALYTAAEIEQFKSLGYLGTERIPKQ